jgi:histidinol dehydrogenase
MTINFWRWHQLDAATKNTILLRSESEIAAAEEKVEPIIAEVKKRGDAALRDFALKFDKATVTNIKATDADFEQAYKALDKQVIEAIKLCAANVFTHHRQQMDRVEDAWMDAIAPGVYGGERITPIERVGIYVPRGKGAFPSMMYMQCIPAVVAGVKQIAVCTPPTADGGLDAASLVAADICGIRNVYKAGGAAAIAAFAFGTESIPKVDQVNGPGSFYVAAARRMLGNLINPGMPAGPSDSLVLADESADASNTAWDLINEAEHGPDSAAILITDSEALANNVAKLLPQFIGTLPDPQKTYLQTVFSKYGGIILCRSMDEALEAANAYAAEHLLLKVKQPEAILPRIIHAGEILIGESTPMVLGNFGIGVNAVLPTGGQARTWSATSVWSFLKRTSLAYVNPKGFEALQGAVTALADYEGFPGHASVLRQRNRQAFRELEPAKLISGLKKKP